ncbi:hypothetical protein V6N11_055389 [Hibiscus sabdariffa]|uniref:Uncharacterized protein n=2 Tax=Hibiscus sabdariffa TaxID=183260 RepID=A0ABR2PF67_9ROSI
MATSPLSMSGPALEVILHNESNDYLNLSGQIEWSGSEHPPKSLPEKTSVKFNAGNSKVGVVYTIKNDIKWIIAWSNLTGESNKVYIDIIDGNVD